MLSDQDVQPGELLTFASNGAGLPLKVQLAASVLSVSGASFIAESDSFGGGSGSGSYDAERKLVGLQVSGASDWEVRDGCSRAAVVSASREQHQSARAAIRTLCERGWPSPLCTQAVVCGDGVCSADERGRCEPDCPAQRCGDSICEPSEYQNCDADCESYSDVPAIFSGDPEVYRLSASNKGSDPNSAPTVHGGCALRGAPLRGAAPQSWRAVVALLLVAHWRGARGLVEQRVRGRSGATRTSRRPV
ncbi:MAG: hypothetical protein ACOY0T_04240 [Myxococcota bacterium]